MAATTYWSPNQALVAQVETYTFSAPSLNNTFTATINNKSITYTATGTDTATTAATALYNLLVAAQSSGGFAELNEITFSNPSNGVVVATALVPGTPFANITINGVAGQGLVMSTGNGLANGIATVHTTANKSSSDVNDPQNWLRFLSLGVPGVRSLPQNTDNVVVTSSSVPMLWNLDALVAVQFGSYVRDQSMTGQIGLPYENAGGYNEWRATYFRFVGPQGSVPAGGLSMILGTGSGGGPPTEQYNVGSQNVTLVVLAGNTVRFLGVHTQNTFTLLGGADLEVATQQGEIATLSSSTADGNSTLGIGPGVTWTPGSTLTQVGGTSTLGSAPATIALSNGAQVKFTTDGLTWATITAQGGCAMTWLAGGTITNLTMTTQSFLDKSQDLRPLTITNLTIDGDTCYLNDPLNVVSLTNFANVKQQVTTGWWRFTGPRTGKMV